MRPIPIDCPLAVGDVVHQAAFGFAAVLAVDPSGASLRWETPGNLHPAWISRISMRDAYRLCSSDGLLTLSVREPDQAWRLTRADPAAAIGRLLLDVGPARVDELREWLSERRLLIRAEFDAWWASVAELLVNDPRLRRDGDRWTVNEDATFPDAPLVPDDPLPAPGTCAPSAAFDLACELARALTLAHGAGQTLDGGRTAFSRVGDTFVARGRPGGEPTADVLTVGRLVLEQVLGVLPPTSVISTPDLLASIGELAPEVPFELLGVLERAVSGDAGLRHPEAFTLLHALEQARAVHGIRSQFPLRHDARVAVGFDTHIGISKALGGQTNQDAVLIAGDPDCALLMIADGISLCTVGSGDLASRLLVESMRKWWHEQAPTLRGVSSTRVHQAIREGLTRANRHILTEAARIVGGKLHDTVPMGTTVVLAVTQGNRVHLAALGDSRGWLAHPFGACLITSDQNLQSQLVRDAIAGLDPDWTDERFALTGYCGHLGTDGRPALPPLFTRTFTLLPGEWVVLATDGFSDFAHEEEVGLGRILTAAIGETSRQHRGEPASLRAMAVARHVVQAANDGGGGDNVTVLAFTLSTDARRADAAASSKSG